MKSFTAGAMAAWGALRVANRVALSDTSIGKEIRQKVFAKVPEERLLRFRKEIEEELARRLRR